jgi:hypothetical protein
LLSTYLRFEDHTKLYAFDAMINCADKPRWIIRRNESNLC